MNCEQCGDDHDGSYASGRFCTSVCAKTFSSNANKATRLLNMSIALKGKTRARPATDLVKSTYGFSNEERKSAVEKRAVLSEKRWRTAEFNLIQKSRVRDRILLEQDGKCACCGIDQTWNGMHLKFQLDHISGDKSDESRLNLRMICANCHTQTPTFCSKNVSADGRLRMIAGARAGGTASRKQYL